MTKQTNENWLVTLGFRVDPAMAERLRIHCENKNVTRSDILRKIFYEGLKFLNEKNEQK